MRLDIYLFSPEIFITAWLIILITQYSHILKQKFTFPFTKFKFYNINPIPGITTLLFTLSIFYFFLQTTSPNSFFSPSGFYCTPLIFYIKLILSILFIFYFIYIRNNFKTLSFYSYEFYIVIFFAFLALNFIITSDNFLNLFIFVEIYSMCVYYLIASKKNSATNVESSVKYFIFGSFSSVFLLFGIFLIYYTTGTLDFKNIYYLTIDNIFLQNNLIFILGTYLICFSFLIKIGVSFFYFWIVDVYSGTSFNMLIFLNIFPKIIYLITLYTLTNNFNLLHLSICVKSLILSSLFIGLLGAARELKTKRFLIFSSIYNITFFSIPFRDQNPLIMSTFTFFLTVYLLNFFVFMLLFSNLRDMRTNMISKNLIDLYEIKVQNPQLAWLFIFFTIFSSGLPLTIIFLAKFLIFFQFSKIIYFFLLFYLSILSSLSFFYYLRIIKLILQGTSLPNIFIQPTSLSLSLIYSSVLWFNLVSIFFFDKFVLFLNIFLLNN